MTLKVSLISFKTAERKTHLFGAGGRGAKVCGSSKRRCSFEIWAGAAEELWQRAGAPGWVPTPAPWPTSGGGHLEEEVIAGGSLGIGGL